MPTDNTEAASGVFTIARTFDAPRTLAWSAWTNPEMLAAWFGPKEVVTTVMTFDLRPGGYALSRMDTPDGGEMWVKFAYREIATPSRLVWVQSFSDADANVVRGPFFDHWPLEILTTVTFEEVGDGTRITLAWVPIDATDAERRSFEEAMQSLTMGWTNSFDQLDALLKERER